MPKFFQTVDLIQYWEVGLFLTLLISYIGVFFLPSIHRQFFLLAIALMSFGGTACAIYLFSVDENHYAYNAFLWLLVGAVCALFGLINAGLTYWLWEG